MGDAQVTFATDDALCSGCGCPLGRERIGIIGVPGVWHAHCLPNPSTVRLISTARAEARMEVLEEALRAAWSGFKKDDAAIAVCAIVDLLPPERREAACQEAAAMTKKPTNDVV